MREIHQHVSLLSFHAGVALCAKKTGHLFFSMLYTLILLLSAQPSFALTQPADVKCVFSPHLQCSNQNTQWLNKQFKHDTRISQSNHQLYISQTTHSYGLSKQTGDIIWQTDTHNEAHYFYPVLDGQSIYLARTDGVLEKRHSLTGALAWSKQLDTGWIYPPAIRANSLITGGQSHQLLTLDSATGNIISNIKTQQELVMPLYQSGQLTLVSSFDRSLTAYQNNNKPRWKLNLDAPVFALTQGNDILIASDMGGHLTAIEPKTGHILWQKKLHANAQFSTILNQNTVLSSNLLGTQYVLDIHTGKHLKKPLNKPNNEEKT